MSPTLQLTTLRRCSLLLAVAVTALIPPLGVSAQSSDLSLREPSGRARMRDVLLHEPALPAIPVQHPAPGLDGALPQRGRDYQPEPQARPATLPEPRLPLLPVPSPPQQLGVWIPTDPASPIRRRQVVAFYGNPRSRYMGILGEQPVEETGRLLRQLSAEYDALNGPLGVLPAFHIIYGTVFTNAEIGILDQDTLLRYIEYARENGFLVFLDHQLGRYSVEEAITAMLPYLHYEHVHLAIDPEWSTLRPGREIGGVSATEINRAQELMQAYLETQSIPGKKMLVVHQFNYRMITDRETVSADYPRVDLIHNADGFGAPAEKIDTWRYNVLARNIPLKGFKLFFPKSWRDGGYDVPLMTPNEVLSLEPLPVYIQYQ